MAHFYNFITFVTFCKRKIYCGDLQTKTTSAVYSVWACQISRKFLDSQFLHSWITILLLKVSLLALGSLQYTLYASELHRPCA